MTLTASCHCGKCAFEIDGELPAQLTRCTCTSCSKRGHLFAYYTPSQLRVTKNETDREYRWQTRTVAHHFCSECGCVTYTDSPDFKPDGSWDGKTHRICVNARLIDDFDAATAPVIAIDGRNLW